MVELSNKNIKEIIKNAEKVLLNQPKIAFTFDRKWSSSFPNNGGVYLVFDKGVLIYVGESANVKERMKDFKRTVNHTFRRKLGKHLFKNATIIKGKFSEEIENYLNQYYLDNISVSAIEVIFGRTEIESNLIQKFKNNGLLNSESKRNATQFI